MPFFSKYIRIIYNKKKRKHTNIKNKCSKKILRTPSISSRRFFNPKRANKLRTAAVLNLSRAKKRPSLFYVGPNKHAKEH